GATVAIQSGQAVMLQPPVVIGSTVTLRWGAAVPGDVIDYMLEAGSGSVLTDIYNASVGAATTISATVGSGTYYVRVRARGAANPPALSNEVVVLVGGGPCTSLPQTPSGIFGWLSGGVAVLGWNQVPDANSYVVEAGSSLGGSDVFNGNVGASLVVSTPVPPGFRAFVRVYAQNPCGRSPASAEILIE
ncbi:MAG: hypothetical protein ACRD1H_04715, partial [Vicinamibacterales bacterium]